MRGVKSTLNEHHKSLIKSFVRLPTWLPGTCEHQPQHTVTSLNILTPWSRFGLHGVGLPYPFDCHFVGAPNKNTSLTWDGWILILGRVVIPLIFPKVPQSSLKKIDEWILIFHPNQWNRLIKLSFWDEVLWRRCNSTRPNQVILKGYSTLLFYFLVMTSPDIPKVM